MREDSLVFTVLFLRHLRQFNDYGLMKSVHLALDCYNIFIRCAMIVLTRKINGYILLLHLFIIY